MTVFLIGGGTRGVHESGQVFDRLILGRQQHSGWGSKVIDRLAGDLRDAYPDMNGFSPRNLKYMRAFSAAWRDRAIVQGLLAQFTWYHNIALLEKASAQADRLSGAPVRLPNMVGAIPYSRS